VEALLDDEVQSGRRDEVSEISISCEQRDPAIDATLREQRVAETRLAAGWA
jgi:hypothetical protein